MKTFRGTFLALCALAFGSLLIADSAPSPQLDKLKSLAGNWEGKSTDGKTIRANYKLVSGGTAVAETLSAEGEPGSLGRAPARGAETVSRSARDPPVS